MPVYRRLRPDRPGFDPLPILALDRFRHPSPPEDADPFSRRVVAFKGGDYDHWEAFLGAFDALLDAHVRGVGVDVATVFPAHEAGGVGGTLLDLVTATLADTGVRYDQLVRRVETAPRQRDRARGERWDAIDDALATLDARGDLAGRTVLLVDDVVVTGASLAAGARLLRERGAERVIGVALGMTAEGETRQVGSDFHLADVG